MIVSELVCLLNWLANLCCIFLLSHIYVPPKPTCSFYCNLAKLAFITFLAYPCIISSVNNDNTLKLLFTLTINWCRTVTSNQCQKPLPVSTTRHRQAMVSRPSYLYRTLERLPRPIFPRSYLLDKW